MNTRRSLRIAGMALLALGLVLAVVGLRGISADLDALGNGSQIVLRDGDLSEDSGLGHFLIAVMGALLLVFGLAFLNAGLISRRRVPVDASTRCGTCARPHDADARFCDGCGSALG